MSGPVNALAVIGNAVCELECHEKGIQPRTNEGLRGHGWATAAELAEARAALAGLVEKAGALNGVKRAGGILVSFDSFADLAIALAGVGGAS